MNLVETVRKAWQDLRAQVENKPSFPFDHEFTFQFQLAWAVSRSLNFSESLNVRFEVDCGKDTNGETIRLDLLLWESPDEKIAVELKAPLRSETGMNSAMTQFRMRFYRDIHRLRHLVETRVHGIRAGIFLAVVNEKGYVVERRQHENAEYRTYHGTRVPPGVVIPATNGRNGYPYAMKMPEHEIAWIWNCTSLNGDVALSPGMKHFWLEPILIHG